MLEAHPGVNSGPARGAGVVRTSHNVSSHLRLLVFPHIACHCDPSLGVRDGKKRTRRDTPTRRRGDLFAAGSADVGEAQYFASALTSPVLGNVMVNFQSIIQNAKYQTRGCYKKM